ncbi:AAA family ATPase [Comamonas piscis]|uniref:AAA family ATPase n=1 Tax=Comamonas piscis TaxID=1562974 RepID=A0A7G5EM72_9BURK|nr:AAA family ATPase [Comamonas piscis]QMV75097.1 AAA family ATPase [Comamonas piscis]WSO33581.1 AAA family ATPase [Comamonas piscis]
MIRRALPAAQQDDGEALRADQLDIRPGEQLERLSLSGDGQLYRLHRASGNLLLTVSDPGSPLLEATQRRDHAYAMRAAVPQACCAVPLHPLLLQGRPALLHTDPGGRPLQLTSGLPVPLRQCLVLATAIAQALAQLHACRVVHQDLRPQHLLVGDGGSVFLIGFMRASKEARHAVAATEPAAPAEAWPYLSPEQTGRIQRSMDARSDLYALGVILYQMACGHLPFEAQDASEWAHCHLARSPVPPSIRHPGVPALLSELILKLLAKAAEDRYQTATGLVYDLQRMAWGLEHSGQMPAMALGTQDLSDRLVLPEQLFGRTATLNLLRQQVQSVGTHGRSACVLLSGYAGVGKTALVAELRASLPQPLMFASGKFEVRKDDIPYATVAQALRQLVTQLLSLDPKALATWRQRLAQALGAHGQVVVNLVPALAHIIGPQPALKEVAATENALRFQMAVQQFLSVFCSEGHPLVFFLDDIHWIDPASLDLFSSLLNAPGLRHVLFVGAYRSNEVADNPALVAQLAQWRDANAAMTVIELQPLSLQDLENLLNSSLAGRNSPSNPLTELAQLLWAKTQGNPLFCKQLLTEMADQRLLAFDHDQQLWRWDHAAIDALDYSLNVAELVAHKMARLEAGSVRLLTVLASLGARATVATLTAVAEMSPAQIQQALVSAQEMGLVAADGQGYRFMHDKIQEAAYAMLPESERASMHLGIARRLLAGHAPAHNSWESQHFDTVNQFLRGDMLVTEDAERMQVASLYLQAARSAMADNAYLAALQYLARAQSLLPANAWQVDAQLCFELARTHAECEFYAGDPEAADRRLRHLSPKITHTLERASLASLQITVCLALDDSARAISTCLAFLSLCGMSWPAHPSRQEVLREYQALRAALDQRTVASLAELPAMAHPLHRATMDVLAAVLPPAFFSDENLVCLVLCRMANLSIESGNTNASPLAYAYLGMVLGPCFDDYPTALAFGRLGYAVIERGEHTRYRARVYMCFAYHVLPWTRDMQETPPLLRKAFAITRETGDITYSGFSSCTLVTSMLFSGDALDLIDAEGGQRLQLMETARFGLIVDIMTAQLRLVAMLQGRSHRFGSLDDSGFDEAAFELHLSTNRSLDIAACWYWIRKGQARFLAGRVAEALQAMDHAEPLLWTSKGHLEFAEYHLWSGLIHAAACQGVSGAARAPHRSKLEQHRAQHAIWAQSSPANFACRLALLEAEAARLDGDEHSAMQHYDDSATWARQASMAHIEALALGLSAQFHAQQGRQTMALALRASARERWLSLGAHGMALHLQNQHAGLLPSAEQARTAVSERPLRSMDVETLVRISQALAAEKGLSQLVQTLMTMTLEYAAADRAVLVLPHGDQLRIQAQAKAEHGTVGFNQQQVPASGELLPLSVLHYCLRTHSHVLIEDARDPGPFASDLYLAQARARSVLCLPLMRRAEPLGILYLENSLTGHVFNADRVALLTLIASMAATSMENASLGEKESLLQEVHHRVKNNLQLISSLLSLQAHRIPEPAVAELFAESRNRVRSMALVHENLYRAGNFARVPMDQHLEKLCAQLGHVYALDASRVRLHVQVDDIELSLSQAVSCGLIVNELVSNALKHAFPDGSSGTIHVRMQPLPNQHYRLTVADSGIGLPSNIGPESAETLGLQLVADLSHQLRGRLRVVREAGTLFCIEFRMDAGLPSPAPATESWT